MGLRVRCRTSRLSLLRLMWSDWSGVVLCVQEGMEFLRRGQRTIIPLRLAMMKDLDPLQVNGGATLSRHLATTGRCTWLRVGSEMHSASVERGLPWSIRP